MNISTSIRRLTYLFIILFVGLSAGLVYWQVVVAQQVASNTFSTYSRQCRTDNAPIRGRIYDRNGILLAYSIPNTKNPTLCGWQRVYTPAAQSLEGVIGYYISPLFGSIGVENQFNDYLNGQVGSTGLNNTIRKMLHNPPVGDDIYLTIDSNLQKIVNQSFDITVPVDGITVFQPKGGSIIVSNPSTGEILAMLSRPGYDANCVVSCTLDQLRKDFAAKGYNTNVIDPNCEKTFSCNLIYFNQLERDPAQPLLERPIDSCYIPGSTYKTMTLMAGLDSGTSHLGDKYYNFNGFNPPQFPQALGPVRIGDGFDKETFGPVGNNISGYTHTYPVNLLYGYTHSDNIIFAQAGAKAGTNTWLNYNRALYVEKQIPFDLPVHVSTVTPQKNLCPLTPPAQKTTSLKQVAENAFGQGVDFITPMQMALINNTVANNGHLMRPTLIYKIEDQNQTILQSFNPLELGAPITDTTAGEVRDAMYGVVRCGSGSLTQVQLTGSKWSIIGKTGTGQVDNTLKTPAESWFITQAPYVFQSNQVPRLTIVAMKENAGEGAFANGPMLRTIYDRIFTEVKGYNDVPPSQPPDPNFCFNTGLLQPHP
ncbi:MAG: penicillin-binding transpeptidase domain-containing protein [Ktedonobacteraceae bacterium]